VTVSATDRLSRLLAMVPFLARRQGIPLAEAADALGITERALVKDLELLFVCGAPGHLPDDLIEAQWEDGHVYLSNVDAIARPLRLGVDEALALLVGLRALADVPGLHDREALDRTMAKLEAAAGEAAAASRQVAVAVTGRAGPLAQVRDGLARSRRLALTYFVPARDETTQREVDPMRVLMVDGRWYLEGWCRRADDVRLFRLDRIEAIDVLDVAAEVPGAAHTRDLGEGLFRPSPEDVVVTLDLAPSGRWVLDHYPTEQVDERPDGHTVVRLRAAGDRWLHTLVLRLGGAARVLDPPALATAVAQRAREALDSYVRT
jgi:proteasome accessory factor C